MECPTILARDHKNGSGHLSYRPPSNVQRMDEDAERALKKERKRQLNGFAKENIWSEEDWDLLTRHFLRFDEDQILSMSLHRLLNEDRESTETHSFWKPDKPSNDSVVRRYRPFNGFRSILNSDSLWFSRTDIFEDQFEGSFAYPNKERRERINRQRRNERGKDEVFSQKHERAAFREKIENTKKRTYINCWREGTDESALFWNAYIGDEFGVAIETTVGDFRRAINRRIANCHLETIHAKIEANRKYVESTPENRDKRGRIEQLVQAVMAVEYSKTQIGSVRYISFDDDIVPQSRYARFFHKRSEFEEEKEFRALFEQPMAKLNSPIDPDPGKPVEVNLDQLIRKVILKPGSPDWFKTRIETLLDHHDIDARVEYSQLDRERPTYGLAPTMINHEYGGRTVDLDDPEERLNWDMDSDEEYDWRVNPLSIDLE